MKHSEAYALIVYEGEGGRETIWNSRDGQAPYEVSTIDGKGRMQVLDEFAGVDPGYVPSPGERVIVDRDPEDKRREMLETFQREWESYAPSIKRQWNVNNLEEALEFIRTADYSGLPQVAIVTEAGWPNVKKE